MGFSILDDISDYTVDQYLGVILAIQNENRALQEESLFAHNCKIESLAKELHVELCVSQLNWTLLKIEEKVEGAYLGSQIAAHEELGYLIELGKYYDLDERRWAPKVRASKSQNM